jgi:hypothetical protein
MTGDTGNVIDLWKMNEELDRKAAEMDSEAERTQEKKTEEKKKGEKKADEIIVQRLVKDALADVSLFHTPPPLDTFADVQVNGHRETMAIYSQGAPDKASYWLKQALGKGCRRGVKADKDRFLSAAAMT